MQMVDTVTSKDEEVRQLEYINARLKEYLADKDYSRYASLINEVLKDTVSISAKYKLYTLMMNHGTDKLTINNLQNRLQNLYCSDDNIEEYIDSIVNYNPKLGYVSIGSKSGMDVRDDYSQYLSIPTPSDRDLDKQFAEADRVIKKVKDILRMILIESKTIPT